MAAHSPVLPVSHLPHSLKSDNMASFNSQNSNRLSGPASPSYFAIPAHSYQSSASSSEFSTASSNESSQMRLPSLRSMQMLPSLNTFSEPSSRQSLSPYEHYPASSYMTSGPRSPLYSPHFMGPSSMPSPMSDSQRIVNKKGPWTKAEDELLVHFVSTQHQPGVSQATHWGDISKQMGELRTAKQCRERYTQNLAPGLNRLPITDDEAAFIKNWVRVHGTQWAELSRQPEVRGRSDNHLKNWWNGQRKQDQDRDRATRKANARRSSLHSLSQRSSASPSRAGGSASAQHPQQQQQQQQSAHHSLSPGRSSLPSSVSPPQQSAPTLSHRHLVLPPLPPQQQSHSPPAVSTPSSSHRLTMANLLN